MIFSTQGSYLICVGKHNICVGNREIILIGKRKIKRPRICHDFKTANFNSRKFKWGYDIPVVPNWFNKGLVVCKTVYGCVHLKDPLESVEKSMGLSPGSGVLFVADMSVTVKGDVKLQ